MRSSQSKFIAALPTPERVRIAQELHDGLAQDLVGIGYSLDLLLSEESLSLNARENVRTTRFAVNELMSKVRQEIFELRHNSHSSLVTGIEEIARSIIPENLFTLHCEDVSINPDHEEEFLKIVKELLRNAVTHARATQIEVHLYPVNNLIYLEISDDGIGGAAMKDHHWGLQGVNERVKALGGTLAIDSRENEGTRISISL